MADGFGVIVFTGPDVLTAEAEALELLAASQAVRRIHFRKPALSETETRSLINSYPEAVKAKLTLHDHFGLALGIPGLGVNPNSRNPGIPDGFQGITSRGCHSLKELAECTEKIDYQFLSPIYPSISKVGYSPGLTFGEIAQYLKAAQGLPPVYALGGVSPEKFPELQQAGFSGAALLGWMWQDVDRQGKISLGSMLHKIAIIEKRL